MVNQDELLTPDEVAQLLKVTRRTVYNWIRASRIPATKYVHGWRIRRGDLFPEQKEAA